MRRSLLALPFVLVACSGRPPEAAPPSDALLDLWAAVHVGVATLTETDVTDACDTSFGTWFADFGVRGIACSTDQAVRLGEASGRAPSRIWTSGPHASGPTRLDLDLTSERDFGRYDPAFVVWAVENLVPRTEGAIRLAQPVYDAHVQRLARVYWLAYQDLAAGGFPEVAPEGTPRAYADFLDGGPMPDAPGFDGGVSMHTLFSDHSDRIVAQLVPRGGYEWHVRYEANAAFGFWLRRRADGTEGLFRDGLRDVMETLDSAWIAGSEA
ncbi:MAG: hypothetical protein AAF594_00285 [Bacteroidota bacterium]